MMYRQGNLVRFWVKDGPKWEPLQPMPQCNGELIHFSVMKKMYMKKGGAGVFHSVFSQSVDMAVRVDSISIPHAMERMIYGVIEGDVQDGEVLPNFYENANMLFLKNGTRVRIKYYVDIAGGYLMFETEENEETDWVRLCLHDEVWLSSLDSHRSDEEARSGFYFEILRYAKLENKGFDLSLIQRTDDIAKYAILNCSDPTEKLFVDPVENSLIKQNLPVIWI